MRGNRRKNFKRERELLTATVGTIDCDCVAGAWA